MIAMQQLFEAAHEVTQFCAQRQGKCFPNWSQEKIFAYISQTILDENLFIFKVKGKVNAIAIAKPTGKGRLVFYEVIGNRAHCKVIFRNIMAKWPDLKRFFAFRVCGEVHDIEELSISAVRRFTS